MIERRYPWEHRPLDETTSSTAVPTTPERVVTALREALSVKASVELDHIGDMPHVVVTGPSGVMVWIDLLADSAASLDGDAAYIAASIMISERWDALELDVLLGELCTELGFCNVYQKERLTRVGPFSIDTFVDAVIEAEGLDPMTSVWRGRVRDIVSKHFGSGPE